MSAGFADGPKDAGDFDAGDLALAPVAAARRAADRAAVACVLLVTIAWHFVSAFDVGLWVQPDSVGYVSLSDWLVQHGDVRHEGFVARTPGYPLLLAGVERLCGGFSAALILLVQHALAIGAAALIGWLAWMLTRSRGVVLAACLTTGLSWSLTAYANVVLTEVPFTTALLATVCLSAHFVQSGRRGSLLLSSLCAGAAALIRPVGLPLGLLPVAALAMRLVDARHQPGASSGPVLMSRLSRLCRRGAPLMAMAVVPFAAAALGWSLTVRAMHGADGANNFGLYNLYLRLVTREGMTEPSSPALEAIRESVAWANERRPPDAQLDYRVDIHAVMAYRQRHECSWAQASSQLGDAAWAICKAHPWTVISGTIRNAAHTLLSVDPVVLRRPEAEAAAWRREGVELPSTAEYEKDFLTRVQASIEPFAFRVDRDGGPLTPALTRLLHAVDCKVLRASGPPGLLGDTLFETWVYLCLAGGLGMMLLGRRRRLWWLTGLAVALPLAVSSFTPGEDPRFSIPLRPILDLWGTAPLIAIITAASRRFGHALDMLRGLCRMPSSLSP